VFGIIYSKRINLRAWPPVDLLFLFSGVSRTASKAGPEGQPNGSRCGLCECQREDQDDEGRKQGTRAVRFHGAKDIRVEDVAEPSGRLAPGEVLIAPAVTGICGTDLHEYIAGPIVTPKEPHVFTGATNPQILGHEFSARVLAVGDAVSHVGPGDRISIQPLLSPRNDYYGKRGLYHLSPQMGCVGLSWAWGAWPKRRSSRITTPSRCPMASPTIRRP
jgi:hypothetical protein